MYPNNANALTTSQLRPSASTSQVAILQPTPENADQTGVENAKQTIRFNLDTDARAMVELGETLPGEHGRFGLPEHLVEM